MVRSLLVPLDGSPFSEHALPLALGLAKRSGAALKLLHVQPPYVTLPPDADLGPPLEEELDRNARAYLDALARRIAGVASVRFDAKILVGEVAPTVRRYAEEQGVNLVVMSTHGRGPVARFWLGSVADELMSDASIPILLVRPHDQVNDLRADVVPRHIVLPLDGTPLAEQILPHAAEVGKAADADFTLLRVVGPITPNVYHVEGAGLAQMTEQMLDQIQRMQTSLREEAQTYLEGVAARLRGQSLRVRTQVVVDEQPAHAILKVAAEVGAGMVALETHGRRGLERMFVGSVADKVIRGATTPVLVHKPTPAAEGGRR
jgi:nucleotide-binding universal stress UspA family protein